MEINILVSVIITTYNRPKYLRETLESIINQTYENFEVLIIDDGSKQPNAIENKTIVNSYNKCNYYYKKNTGQPDSRNFGIKRAKGEFIAFCDDDDLWIKEKLELQVKILSENPKYDMTTGCIGYINHYSEIIKNKIKCHEGYNHGYVFKYFLEKNRTSSVTPMMRKSIFNDVGYFNPSFTIAEDWEFWRRLSYVSEFYFHKHILAYVREHNENMSKTRTGDVIERFKLYRKLTVSLLKWGKNRFSKEEYKLIYSIEKKFYKRILSNHYKGFNKLSFFYTVFKSSKSDFFHLLKLFLIY